jgi:hypothetical protein
VGLLNVNSTASNKSSRKKRIAFIAIGVLLTILGLSAIIGGGVLLFLNAGTDPEGYALSESYVIDSSSSAFALWVAPMKYTGTFSWLGYSNIVAMKWVITSTTPGNEIFAGWAKSSDVGSYVTSYSYETPYPEWNRHTAPYNPEINITTTKIYNIGSPSRPPAEEDFWMKTATTSSSSAIYWDPYWDLAEGMNIFAVMNTDGSSQVNAEIQLGYKIPILGWLPYLIIPLGIVFLLAGLLVFKRRNQSSPQLQTAQDDSFGSAQLP